MKLEQVYTIYDAQQGEDTAKYVDWSYVRGFAIGIMEGRAEAVEDELAEKFNAQLAKGYDNIADDYLLNILSDWGYQIIVSNILEAN